MVQVENEELLNGTGAGHFAGFFSTSGILRHNVAGATDTTVLDAIEQAIDAIEQAIEQMRSGPALAEPRGSQLVAPSGTQWLHSNKFDGQRDRHSQQP